MCVETEQMLIRARIFKIKTSTFLVFLPFYRLVLRNEIQATILTNVQRYSWDILIRPPCLFPQGSQCKRTWICQRRPSVNGRGSRYARPKNRPFLFELNGGETDEQQVKCWVSFEGQSHVFSRASSRSTCVFHFLFFAHRFSIAFFVNNITFSLSNALLLSFSFFLSQRWPKGRPSQVTNFWLTHNTI